MFSSVFWKVRKEIEMENLANRYLRDVIKHECWDAMCVKGRAIKVTSDFWLIFCSSLLIA